MKSGKRTNGVLLTLSVIGVTATLVGATLGASSALRAGAAPIRAPFGTLGVGERTIAPVADIDSGAKVDQEAPSAIALETPVAMTAAPLPKPAARQVTRASASSRALPGGWQSAKVSWYGPGFYGRRTAGGTTLTETSMIVAHRSLPFGTKIQFEYRGRTCTAVVMDRGPYIGGRTFDLGPGTAKALGFGGVGTVKYRIIGR